MSDYREYTGRGYDNVDDAAAAALMWIASKPNVANQEYMALLGKAEDGKYYRTGIQTQGKRHESSWSGPFGAIPAGIVHNHPDTLQGDKYPATHFSNTDITSSRQYGEPNYVVAARRDSSQVPEQRKYTPGETPTYRRDPKDLRSPVQSSGAEFLAQIPIDEWKIMIAMRVRDSNMSPDVKLRILKSMFAHGVTPPGQGLGP